MANGTDVIDFQPAVAPETEPPPPPPAPPAGVDFQPIQIQPSAVSAEKSVARYTPAQQAIIDRIKSGQQDFTFGPGSPGATAEDKGTVVGGKHSPASGFAVHGGVALPASEYNLFTPEQRRQLGIMDIAPEDQRGKIERYYDARAGGKRQSFGPAQEQGKPSASLAGAQHLEGLTPTFKEKLERWSDYIYSTTGYKPKIISGHRSSEEQARLYEIHKRGGPLAAPPGKSYHEYGSATDISFIDPNGKTITDEESKDLFRAMHKSAEAFGIKGIGENDLPHFQDADYAHVSDIPKGVRQATGAGEIPSGEEIRGRIAQIQEESGVTAAKGKGLPPAWKPPTMPPVYRAPHYPAMVAPGQPAPQPGIDTSGAVKAVAAAPGETTPVLGPAHPALDFQPVTPATPQQAPAPAAAGGLDFQPATGGGVVQPAAAAPAAGAPPVALPGQVLPTEGVTTGGLDFVPVNAPAQLEQPVGEIPRYEKQTVNVPDVAPLYPEGSPEQAMVARARAGDLSRPPGAFARDTTIEEAVAMSLPRVVPGDLRAPSETEAERLGAVPPQPTQLSEAERLGAVPAPGGPPMPGPSTEPRTIAEAFDQGGILGVLAGDLPAAKISPELLGVVAHHYMPNAAAAVTQMEKMFPATKPAVEGLTASAAETLTGLTTPSNVLILGGMMLAPQIGLPAWISRATSLGFSYQAAHGAYENAKQLTEQPGSQEWWKSFGNVIVNSAFAATAGAHGFKGAREVFKQPNWDRTKAISDLTRQLERGNITMETYKSRLNAVEGRALKPSSVEDLVRATGLTKEEATKISELQHQLARGDITGEQYRTQAREILGGPAGEKPAGKVLSPDQQALVDKTNAALAAKPPALPDGWVEEGLHTEYPEIGEKMDRYIMNNDPKGMFAALKDPRYEEYQQDLQRTLRKAYGDEIPVARISGYGTGGTGKSGGLAYVSVSTNPKWGEAAAKQGYPIWKGTVKAEDVVLAGHEAEGELIVKKSGIKTEPDAIPTVSGGKTVATVPAGEPAPKGPSEAPAAGEPAPAGPLLIQDPTIPANTRYQMWDDLKKLGHTDEEVKAMTTADAQAKLGPPSRPTTPPAETTPDLVLTPETAEPSLPEDLKGAKPRYNYGSKSFELEFESDLDKASYIAAQATKSRADARYVKFAMDATGLSEGEIRTRGQTVRARIKAQAATAEPGRLRIAREGAGPQPGAPPVNRAASIIPEGKAGFDLLDNPKLGLTQRPKDVPIIPEGKLPEGTIYKSVGEGYHGNLPRSYAFTPEGLVYSDANRMYTHGGVSPWVLEYKTKWYKGAPEATAPQPGAQPEAVKPAASEDVAGTHPDAATARIKAEPEITKQIDGILDRGAERRRKSKDPELAARRATDYDWLNADEKARIERLKAKLPTADDRATAAAESDKQKRKSQLDSESAAEIKARVEHEKEMQDQLEALGSESGPEFLDAVIAGGGLPAKGSRARSVWKGELDTLEEAVDQAIADGKLPRSAKKKLFRADAPDLDRLALDLQQYGFDLARDTDVIDIMHNRLATDKPHYGTPGKGEAPEMYGMGAAHINEPLADYEKRSFGDRLKQDKALSENLREKIGSYYEPISNRTTLEEAVAAVDKMPMNQAVDQVLHNERLPYHVRSAMGQLLIKRLNAAYDTLTKAGDTVAADRVLDQAADLAGWAEEFGTRLGQGVQSFAMWSRLTPEGQLRGVEKKVNKARNDYTEEHKAEIAELKAKILELQKAQLTDAERMAELKKLFGRNPTAKRVKPYLQKLLDAARSGKFTDEIFYNIVSDRLGLPKFDQATARQIMALAFEVAKAPEGLPKDKAVLNLQRYIATKMGFAPKDLPLGVWYGNMLSGYNTQIVNTFDTLVNVMSETFALSVINPKAAGKIYSNLFKGLAEGTADALVIWNNGRIRGTAGKYLEMGNLMEMSDFGTKGGVPIRVKGPISRAMKATVETKFFKYAVPLNAWKYVGRLMMASDSIMFRGARQAKAAALADYAARQEGHRGKALDRRVREMLGQTAEQYADFAEQAKAEGFTGAEKAARIMELRDRLQSAGATADAEDFAGVATYNHMPRGFMGKLATVAGQLGNIAPPVKLIVPFTKIVANVTNRSLNYSPWGFKRALMGYSFDQAPLKLPVTELPALLRKRGAGYGKLSPEERTVWDDRVMHFTRATMGTAGVMAAWALQTSGYIQIHGNGPKDSARRKQLIDAGYKPYSIQIGDHYYSFLPTPLAITFGALGNMSDTYRYHELDSKHGAQAGLYALARTANVITSQSFLSGLSNFFNLVGANPDQAVAGWRNFVAQTAGGFSPRIITDIERLFDPTKYSSDTLMQDLMRNTPFASITNNAALNAFGEVSTLPRQRFISEIKPDMAWQIVVNRQLRVPVPDKFTKVPDGRGGERQLTPEEYYKLLEDSGPKVKQWILTHGSTGDPTETQERLNKAAAEIRQPFVDRIKRSARWNPID